MTAVTIEPAQTADEIAEARRLFQEYAASLGFSLCFQGFDREVAELPGDYAPPGGRLLLARSGDQIAGCVALRRIEDGVGEMKRLFVRPAYRGGAIGRRLAVAVMDEARAAGYSRIRLDTIASTMKEAVALYRSLDFREIPPYRENPIAGALYMERSMA
jgi:ribosomal protein S18 acetylase RimI-like enzyme